MTMMDGVGDGEYNNDKVLLKNVTSERFEVILVQSQREDEVQAALHSLL